MERKQAFKALVGSVNYNLATPESDKDYKVFVIPTFTDLYHRTLYSDSVVGAAVDEEIHDIRKLVNLFWKSNVNFVEVLFSKEIIIQESDSVKQYIHNLITLRNEIAAMNLPYLYKACNGMYVSKSKLIEKGNEGTRHLVDEIGYDTKSAMHAYRILDFIERFAANDFSDFKAAIEYDNAGRDFMLGIKHGALTKEAYDELVQGKLMNFNNLKATYLSKPLKEDVKAELEWNLIELVKKRIHQELQGQL
ncbi:DNA polymerase beta superfamily protein [Halalkalibacter urbisdiaboli]|uniref:DNA polymerase beta superfamily protein n=1 Tax=Halalkalibacter urbisdiaboli TaxID=1960589 RepID=UPI000B449292|nr:nucleotidyltransferase domain-containing protein [Halalkalibacter urbisdiaboli]